MGSPMTTMTMQLHTKELDNLKIKETDDINNIINDILNKIFDVVKNKINVNKIDGFIHEIDKLTIDKNILSRKLNTKILSLSNMISMNCRRGPANCIIIPHQFYKKYNDLIQSINFNMLKTYINYTDAYTDKIIILRNDPELTNPGMMLFTDVNLDGRYLKIKQIMNKMNKNINIKINYVIAEIGNVENNIQILQLKNFD